MYVSVNFKDILRHELGINYTNFKFNDKIQTSKKQKLTFNNYFKKLEGVDAQNMFLPIKNENVFAQYSIVKILNIYTSKRCNKIAQLSQ